ncbi:MAG: surface antigen [Blastococcus sp.]|nr:surface antigen [Blastococcus sp.]
MATLNPHAPHASKALPVDASTGDGPAGPDGDLAAATTAGGSTRVDRRRRTAPPRSHVAYALGVATVCAVAFADLVAGPVAASPQEQSASVAVAEALGIERTAVDAPVMEDPDLLEQLAASRAERDSEQATAAASQAQAEEAAIAARAEAEARAAAEAAAAAAAAEAAAAAQAAETEAAAAVTAAASTAVDVIARVTNSAGSIKPVAQAAANAVVSNVPGADRITLGGTRASAADPGGHPSGLAVDYMVGSNSALGDAIAEYHIAHWNELGVEYIIWQQRMLSSPNGSWKGMENRGSATANHMDHPHVNYRG